MSTSVNTRSSVACQAEVSTVLDQTSPRKRVGILGGTFNPPHYGHLVIAEQVREELELDSVHFMPTAQPAHLQGKNTIDAALRVDMVELAIQSNPQLTLDLTEVIRGGKSYTIETMKSLKEANPTVDYYFIIGQDMVLDLPNWEGIDELMQLVEFVAVRRPGYIGGSDYPLLWIDVVAYDVSSSMIRQRVSLGQSVSYLTPPAVINYIEQKGLYKHGTID